MKKTLRIPTLQLKSRQRSPRQADPEGALARLRSLLAQRQALQEQLALLETDITTQANLCQTELSTLLEAA